MQQRTVEWYRARCGKVTASEADRVVSTGRRTTADCDRCGNQRAKPPRCKCGAPIRLAPGEAYESYLTQLMMERITGSWDEIPPTRAMEHGIEYESAAREAYEFATQTNVSLIGFVAHEEHPMIGCSPDGLVEQEGLLEVICPMSRTKHMKHILKGPLEKLPQILFQLGVTRRAWCDFVSWSFEGSFGPLRLCTKRIFASDHIEDIAHMMARAVQLDNEVNQRIQDLKQL